MVGKNFGLDYSVLPDAVGTFGSQRGLYWRSWDSPADAAVSLDRQGNRVSCTLAPGPGRRRYPGKEGLIEDRDEGSLPCNATMCWWTAYPSSTVVIRPGRRQFKHCPLARAEVARVLRKDLLNHTGKRARFDETDCGITEGPIRAADGAGGSLGRVGRRNAVAHFSRPRE